MKVEKPKIIQEVAGHSRTLQLQCKGAIVTWTRFEYEISGSDPLWPNK